MNREDDDERKDQGPEPEASSPQGGAFKARRAWGDLGARFGDLKIGDAIGGLVRRVGEMVDDISESERVPAAARERLDGLLTQWGAEGFDELFEALQRTSETPAEDALPPKLRADLAALVWTHARLIEDPVAQGPLPEALLKIGDPPRAASRLVLALRELEAGRSAAARDELRRARAKDDELSRHLVPGFARLHALLSARAWALAGQPDKVARAIEEAQRIRAGDEDRDEGRLAERVDLWTLDAWLALDRLDDADALSAELCPPGEISGVPPAYRSIRARVLAARGEYGGALELVSIDARQPSREDVRLALACMGRSKEDAARALDAATAWLREAPSEGERLRLWALAKLGPRADRSMPASESKAVIDALLESLQQSADLSHQLRVRELAFVGLRLGAFDACVDALGQDSTPEAILLRALAKDAVAAEALDAEGRFRLPPAPAGPAGPDECSPLRRVDLVAQTLASRRAYLEGRAASRRGEEVQAHAAFVDALVEDPDFELARQALEREAPFPADGRLESTLAAITERLGSLPQQLSGVPVEGLAEALEASIAARERLARPLTIAIMGEFSAGKSTFVNAWLGRKLAPMGALPTTCTINVFRRGGQGHARVHRREGRIDHVDVAQVPAYLEGLDEAAAGEIRHVEIERGDAGFGDATVVDTPGLNALDPYHEQVAREFLAEADAIVWIFSATRGAADSERAMLEELRGDGRQVLGILNKADILEAGEIEELTGYLRERLGEVLVDVVPFCATEALAHRVESRGGANPMEPVEAALERHFLAKARSLKDAVVRRRVDASLAAALEGVEAAAQVLEGRAQRGREASPSLRSLRVALQSFGDALAERFGQLDGLLMREILAMGIAEVGEGRVEGRPHAGDLDYLARRLDRELAACVHELANQRGGPEDARLFELAADHARPWLQGHLRALASGEEFGRWINESAAAAKQGEAALRSKLRARLVAMGHSLTVGLRELDRKAAAAYAAAARRAGGRPRAEALRLRVNAAGQLRAARDALAVPERP